jgi:hypothetical protein
MFGGWELTFEFDGEGKAAGFSGGLYPWRFARTGDVPAPAVVDEGAALLGSWTGTIASPLGAVPSTLTIAGPSSATVSALTAQDAAVEEFVAERGRVSGRFDVSVPVAGIGDLEAFLRLTAAGGMLRGTAYARGAVGEVGMPVELERGE